MDAIRSAVFTACLCAVLISAIQMCSPEKMRKELKVICGLVLIVCVVSVFTDGRISVDLSEPVMTDDSGYEELSEAFEEAALDETKRSVEMKLASVLNENGMTDAEVSIVCTFDEYNCVKVDSARIYITDGYDAEAAESLIRGLLPETEIEVIERDDERLG